MTPLRVQRRLLRWYERHGRANLPWRALRDPYRTVISEFMLAQTQVERVVPKFEAFVERFPDFAALARASAADVLREWKGLGYNSRAVRVQHLAKVVVERHGGMLPRDGAALRGLPGVGPYTAAAIRAFAFNIDDAPVDTNVRRVLHRLGLGVEHPPRATARELAERARALVPPGRAHDWNSALMDLGAAVCTARSPQCGKCPLRVDCAAAPIEPAQLRRSTPLRPGSVEGALPFKRTTRYARGRIVDRLRDLPPGRRISLLDLHRAVAPVIPERSVDDVREFVRALERDGLVTSDGDGIALRE
ncbi:MAG: A/G-specific adenine glycosylase [Candidatus Eremiobacteraeota bacterium]|nr:A/G-specific adenine glycosylase [Candidatus Eremiobacteraeota bacterium]MBV8497712.1 A/G-specific adenine glycosylase [Candidatus Eremiobacteraeota bacterium]